MKKSLLLTTLCLSTLGVYAQDDDVYFVPSSKDKIESKDTYNADPGRSTYTPIVTNNDEAFSQSNWANGRGMVNGMLMPITDAEKIITKT